MQTNSINNLIFNICTSSNNNIKHYYIIKKHSTKHIKINTNSLQKIYNNLFKNYKCSNKQLALIQFIYNTNCYKQTTYAYNIYTRKQIKQAINCM